MKLRHACLLSTFLLGCGSESGSSSDVKDPYANAPTIDTLGKDVEVEDGYTRYYTSVQEVPPGGSLYQMEWIEPPLERDMDVISVKGDQTVGGHHVTLNASSAVEEVGTVREFLDEDQLTATTVGAAGDLGKAKEGFDFPDGYVMRVYEGQGLYLQTHYLNLTDSTVQVQSYVDVKLADASDERTVMTIFANNSTLSDKIPAGMPSSVEVECELEQEVTLLMFANHAHEHAVSVLTDATLPDGSEMVLKEDPQWNQEWILDPNYTRAYDAPVVLPAGTKLRTRCDYENTSDEDLSFPDEMCVFVAYSPTADSISCNDGQWMAGQAGETEAPGPVTRIGEGACTSDEDFASVEENRDACLSLPNEDVVGCGLPLLEGDAECIVECFTDAGASNGCGQCYGNLVACQAQNCSGPCSGDPSGEECASCIDTECCGVFEACSGLSC